MEDTLAVIDRIIKEHKMLMGKVESLEQVANDAEAIAGLEKTRETFMPGRLGQAGGLDELSTLVDTIAKGLEAHFDFEETALLSAIEKHGDRKLVSALHTLLLEHKDLRQRLAHTRNHLAELISQKASRFVWEASAHDMRAHISHTRKLLEAHAAIEQELLQELRNELAKEEGKS